MGRSSVLICGMLAFPAPAAVAAQALDTMPPLQVAAGAAGVHRIRWWHGAVAAGGLAGLMLLDGPVQRYAQHNDGAGADGVARFARRFGQPEVYGTVTLGLLAAGAIAGRPQVTRAGGRLAASLALAGITVSAAKYALGRPRPEQSLDPDAFAPFSGQTAMPSGHTTVAFALATSLADDIRRPWATVGLYGMATAVGWSRINDNRHWLTDAAAGALLGITAAKLASGRWRIFGLRAPALIAAPRGTGVGWSKEF